jgi:hypothetical protein
MLFHSLQDEQTPEAEPVRQTWLSGLGNAENILSGRGRSGGERWDDQTTASLFGWHSSSVLALCLVLVLALQLESAEH